MSFHKPSAVLKSLAKNSSYNVNRQTEHTLV